MKIDTGNPTYVILYTAVVSAAFTAAIMALNAATRPIVERNERLFRKKALVDILFHNPDAENYAKPLEQMSPDELTDLFDRRIYETSLPVPGTDQRIQLFVAYRQDIDRQGGRIAELPDKDQIVGYAIRINGVGFWEPISGYLAMGPELKYSRGIVFDKQGETPGLGAKITEKPFRSQWRPGRELQIGPDPEDGKFVYITQSAPDSKNAPSYGRHVDSITAATQTSMAVERFVNKDLLVFYDAAEAADLVAQGPPGPGQTPEMPEQPNPTPPAGQSETGGPADETILED
jgi:Na+-transporting NADH:ubiquinone oxidoreductase subunit C